MSKLDELLIPVPLQRIGDESILRPHEHELALGQIGFLTGTLNLRTTKAIHFEPPRAQFLMHFQRHIEHRRLHGVDDDFAYDLVDVPAENDLAAILARLDPFPQASIDRFRVSLSRTITDSHVPATAPAHQHPLQQSNALPWRTLPALPAAGIVVVAQPGTVCLVILPTDVGRMSIRQEYLPLAAPKRSVTTFAVRPLALTSAPKNVCACVAWIVQYLQNARVLERSEYDVSGPRAAEAFSVVSIATYIDRLAAEAKAVYPLPMYQNVWLATFGGMPGRNYPSGGAVQHMLDLALEHTKHLDLLGPDIYMHGYRQFHSLCQTYATGDNPLYIVEHSSSPTGRAERNVFYAIGQYGAIGFDPWAIDSPFPERDVPPPVDPIGQEWAPQAYALRDSYVAIGRAIEPIVEAQGTDRLFTFVQEPGETWAGWAAKGCDLVIHYTNREGAGRGMAIQLGDNEFLVLGTGFRVTFQRPYPGGTPRREKSVVKGEYIGDRWVPLHLIEGKHAYFLEPGVARVELEEDAQ